MTTRAPIFRRPVVTTVIAGAAALALLTGCGGSSAGSDDPVIKTSSDTTSAGTTSKAASTSQSATAPTGGNGTSVPAGSVPKLTNPGANDVKVTLNGTTYTPSTLDIRAGTIVTFSATDGKTHAVKITGVDAATLSGGLIESFLFPGPGTFAVTDEVSTASMTIRVSS